MDDIQKANQAQRLQVQENVETMSKGESLPVGTTRTHGGRTFIKTPGGWKYHGKGAASVKSGTDAKAASTSHTSSVEKVNDITFVVDIKSQYGTTRQTYSNVQEANRAKKQVDDAFRSGSIKSTGDVGKVLNSSGNSDKIYGDLYKLKSSGKITQQEWAGMKNDVAAGKSEKVNKMIAAINTKSKGAGQGKHIGDMTPADKQKWAAQLGVDTKGKSASQINKLLVEKNVDRQIANFKASKNDKMLDGLSMAARMRGDKDSAAQYQARKNRPASERRPVGKREPMTFREILADPKGKAIFESIEEYIVDLRDDPTRKEHLDGLKDAVQELERGSGYKYDISEQLAAAKDSKTKSRTELDRIRSVSHNLSAGNHASSANNLTRKIKNLQREDKTRPSGQKRTLHIKELQAKLKIQTALYNEKK